VFASELGLSRSTVGSFFRGIPIDYWNFVEISEKLGLDWQAIAYIEQEPPIDVQLSSKEPPPNSETTRQQTQSQEIDWRQICRAMLEAQHNRRLTTNPLTTGDGVTFELDEIYVPLGLVQRKQQHRVGGDVSPEQGSRVYEPETEDEIVQTFQNEQFFEQVLRPGRSKRIAIIGEPGAGKTTLLQKIAAWILENTSDVPIWISLADLQGKNLKEYLPCDWLEAATRKVRVTEAMQEALGELFNSGRVWLLLDAVDEMAVGGQSLAPLQLIANQLIGWIADAKVVLTCRLNVWDAGKNALEAFETYRNSDLSYGDAQNSDQVEQFIRRWFRDNPELAERLRVELDQPGRERIKDAVKNPLRLALLCRTWILGQGGLPNTKAGLYQQFTEALYEWKQERFPTTSTQRRQLNRALGELAKRAISEEKTKFRLRYRLVGEVLGESDEELFELALQLGWLNQVGVAAESENRGEKVYAFFHPTFQEYLAAQAIDDWHYFLNHIPLNPAEGTYRIFEPQWKEVILLWLGREDVPYGKKEDFIEALVEFEDGCRDFYGCRAYFLAAAGIAEFGDCSRASEIVAQIVKLSFGYFNIERQQWRTFIAPIEEGARAALQETEYTQACVSLVKLLEVTEDENTCRQVAESLGKIDPGNSEAIAVLVQLIESTENKFTLRHAVESLGKVGTGNRTAIAALVQLIKSTQDDLTCSMTADTLWKIDSGNQTAIAALVQLIKSTENEDIRTQAAYSLRTIDPGNQTALASLVQRIESSDGEETRWRATYSLGKIDSGNPTTIAALVQLLESSEDDSIRCQVAESLGKIDPGNQTALAVLVQLLESSEHEETRWLAAESLARIGISTPRAITELMQLLESSEDEETRWLAADSLGKIDPGNQTAIAVLVQLLESSQNEDMRRQSADSLVKIGTGNSEAIAALAQLIELTEDEFTLSRVIESLGNIHPGNQTAITALEQLLKSSQNDFIRSIAADSLGKIHPGNPTAITVLVQLLELTEDDSIRWRVAESLKRIVRDEQLTGVVKALKDYLSNETYKNDFRRFYQCYEVIWHCAQIMTYPDFYQAWHNQLSPT
jgi:HEAT repeat protein